jgi:pimeloyl-ACP methyl ester carboxylesterase
VTQRLARSRSVCRPAHHVDGELVGSGRISRAFELSPVLASSGLPALVLTGAPDRLVNPAESRAMAELVPKGQLIEFPDARHALPLERTTEFNAAVTKFAGARLRVRAPSQGRPRPEAGPAGPG